MEYELKIIQHIKGRYKTRKIVEESVRREGRTRQLLLMECLGASNNEC